MARSNYHINQEEIAEYLKDLRKLDVMTPAREKEISKIIQNDPSEQQKDDVEREIIEGNLRFVITVAKDYQNQGIPLADLIAEGNYGLLKAINNFDWSRGYRFISYAVWWVKQSILQCLNEHSRTIRLPANVVQDLQKAKRVLKQEGKELDAKLQSLPVTFKYDRPINEDGDTILDLIENKEADNPEDIFQSKESLKLELKRILNVLDEREKIIVVDYFGLTGVPKTLADIGLDFNLTKERVRQIKEKALRKLRNDSETLLDYMD
jgi:RNA polymerase primary sigma factor